MNSYNAVTLWSGRPRAQDIGLGIKRDTGKENIAWGNGHHLGEKTSLNGVMSTTTYICLPKLDSPEKV